VSQSLLWRAFSPSFKFVELFGFKRANGISFHKRTFLVYGRKFGIAILLGLHRQAHPFALHFTAYFFVKKFRHQSSLVTKSK
jgi:hypothetical protein